MGQDVAGYCGQFIVVLRPAENAAVEGDGMLQQELLAEPLHPLGSVLVDGAWQFGAVAVLDAVKHNAHPCKQAVIFSDMGGKLVADRFYLH